MKYLKSSSSYNKIVNNLENLETSDLYEYFGVVRTFMRSGGQHEWKTKLREFLNSHKSKKMSPNDLSVIGNHLISLVKSYVVYRKLDVADNRRFGNCWFLNKSVDNLGFETSWDICIQLYNDDWYIVKFGASDARCSYWFKCDTLDGVKKLIDDVVKK